MEIVTRVILGVFSVVMSIFIFVLNSQNKKIDDIGRQKTGKSLCKTVHTSIDNIHSEIKDDIGHIKNNQTELLVAFAKIETCVAGIKKAIEKQG